MNRWYSPDGSHGQPLREGERDSPGRHVDLMEIKVLSDSRCVCLIVLGWVVFFQVVWEMRTFVDRKERRRNEGL